MREPIVLEGKRLTLDITEYNYRGAKESDYSMLITSPTVIFDTGEQKVKIVYLELDDACSDIVSALKSVNYEAVSRTSGMRSTSKVIGYNPRVTLRRDYCTTSSLSNENPHAHTIITGYAHKIDKYYQQYNTELYKKHQKMVNKVLLDCRLEELLFTFNIINKNNPYSKAHMSELQSLA